MISEFPKISPNPIELLERQEPVSQPIPSGSPEEADFLVARQRIGDTLGSRLAVGYQLAKQTLSHFQLYDRISSSEGGLSRVPSIKQILARFNDEDLMLLLEYQKPTIVIRPPKKGYQELMDAFTRHYPYVQVGPIVRELNVIQWAPDKEFRPFIVEAACNILPKRDILSEELNRRIWRRLETRASGEFGMTSELYVLLAMQSIVRKKIIDERTFTILDGDTIIADRYAGRGRWLKGQLAIDWVPVEDLDSVRGRFRRVLRGSNG